MPIQMDDVFKEIDELENKIKTEINLEKLKEIRKEIAKIEHPKLKEIIDIDDVREQLWQHYRFSTDDERKEAFFHLVNSKCDNELLNWETKVNLISRMEEKIKEEVKKLHNLLDETKVKLEKLEKEKHSKENKIHKIKQKIQEYDEKYTTSKQYKTFTITIFLIFSLILASGTAIILNKIGTTSETTLKAVKDIKIETTQANKSIQTSHSKYQMAEETPKKSKFEVAIEESQKSELKKEPKKNEKEESSKFNYKYIVMSLIFLAVGKIVSLLYEKMRHPKWAYFVLAPLFFITVGILIYSFSKLESFQMSQQNITRSYEKLLYAEEKCKDSDFAADWNDLGDDYGDTQLACLIISDVLSTPIAKSLNDRTKLENKEKNIITKNLQDGEIEDDMKRMYIGKIFNQYKLYKKYRDDFITFKEKVDFYNVLSFIMAIVGEILFSSMAWMMLSEKFYGNNMIDSFKLDKEKSEKELAEIENKIKYNKILIGKIKDVLQELNNYATEIESLNLSNYYNKEALENKKQIIKQTCLADANFILQSVNSYIIKKLAQGDSK